MRDVISSGNSVIRKLHFLYRSIINPLRLYRCLKREKASLVIMNDFDQLSSFFWVPLFKKLKRTHHFAIILHDPDRDKYLPVESLSAATMKKVMEVMDMAFYHEYLPDKPYYANCKVKAVVPHGIYPVHEKDKVFYDELLQEKQDRIMMGIIGNIRDEKNYTEVIDAMPSLDNIKLLVAGKPASTAVPIEAYRKQITALGVDDDIIWHQQFLSDEAFASAIEACDIILLYYKSSFQSQSGVLNVIAPYKKKLVVSDTNSALKQTVANFELGSIVPLNDRDKFVSAINESMQANDASLNEHWDRYIEYSSWDNHVAIVLKTFQSFRS
jgi:glycosyltransferase involved in cell wall biosynthesis